MTVNIQGKDVELRYGFRSLIIYEKIMGASFIPKGLTELIVMFYSVIMASEPGITFTYDQFMDFLDQNPGLVEEFSNWLLDTLNKNGQFKKDSEGEPENTEEPKNV